MYFRLMTNGKMENLRQLHARIICTDEVESVKDILREFTTVLSDVFDDITLDLEDYEDLIDVVKPFIVHMHVKQAKIEDFNDRSYYDTMAALVSYFIDILFKLQKEKKRSQVKLIGKTQLVSSISAFLFTIFANSNVHILDSIIQLQSSGVLKRKYVGPILIEMCKDETFVSTPEKYLKTIIIFKYFMRKCRKAVKGKLKRKALKLKNPSGLIEWLKELKQKQLIKLINRISPKKWTRILLSTKFNNKLICKFLDKLCQTCAKSDKTIEKPAAVGDDANINIEKGDKIDESVLFFTDKGNTHVEMAYDSENSCVLEKLHVPDVNLNGKSIQNESRKKSESNRQSLTPQIIVSSDESDDEMTDEWENALIKVLNSADSVANQPEIHDLTQDSDDSVLKLSASSASEYVQSENSQDNQFSNPENDGQKADSGKSIPEKIPENHSPKSGISPTIIVRQKHLNDSEIVDLLNESDTSRNKSTEDALNVATECLIKSFDQNSSDNLSEKSFAETRADETCATSTPFTANRDLLPLLRSPRVVLTDFRKQLEDDTELNLRLSMSSSDNFNSPNVNDVDEYNTTLVAEENPNSISSATDQAISSRLRKRTRLSDGPSSSKESTKVKKRRKNAVSTVAMDGLDRIEITDLNDGGEKSRQICWMSNYAILNNKQSQSLRIKIQSNADDFFQLKDLRVNEIDICKTSLDLTDLTEILRVVRVALREEEDDDVGFVSDSDAGSVKSLNFSSLTHCGFQHSNSPEI